MKKSKPKEKQFQIGESIHDEGKPSAFALDRDTLRAQFEGHASDLGLVTHVFSDGPISADVAIIGEGPGSEEMRSGIPFTGHAGNLLWDSLRASGLHRANVYSTNVVKRQISLTRRGNEKNIVHRDELERWMSVLSWELSQLPNLKYVFVLGNYALEAVVGFTGITSWRGSVLDIALPGGRQGKAVISINPAYAQRELKFEPIFKMDCNKLKRVIAGTFKPHDIETLINPSFKQTMSFLRDLQKAKKPTAADIETINGYTACIGFANDPHYGICINWRDVRENRYSFKEELEIRLEIQKLANHFKKHKVPLIGQNSQFDWYWTALYDQMWLHFSDDTLLQHHTLYPQLPHGLAFLVAQYTNHPFYKDDAQTWREGGDIDTFWRYNGKDSCLTLAVWSKMMRELEQQGMLRFYRDHVMRATPHLVQATVHGVAVDMDRKADIVEAVSEDVQKIKRQFWDIVQDITEDEDYEPNPGSHQQMRELYFQRLRLKGYGTSTDETNRKHMLKEPSNSAQAKEMLVLVDKYSEEAKFLGTYAKSKPGADNRFRCQYNQFGVQKAPGRLSSSSLLDGQGGNMQNQPERAKEMFIADPDTVFFYFDLAQAEARVVGWRAGIEKWMQQFEQARLDGVYDCHRALAADMFKVAYDLVPTSDWDEDGKPTIRYTSKRCRHGLNYRMERHRLAEVTGLPYHTAQKAFALYHSVTPELNPWWKEEERLFRQNRQVFNAFGRRHKVIQRLDEEALKSIVAFYPQSTIGDKITQVWYQAEEDDKWPMDARIAIDVHDNLVGMASQKTWKTALSICIKYAESPIMVKPTLQHGRPSPLAKPIPLIVPADGKVSYPVRMEKDPKTGKTSYVEDPKGIHRWSHLRKVKL